MAESDCGKPLTSVRETVVHAVYTVLTQPSLGRAAETLAEQVLEAGSPCECAFVVLALPDGGLQYFGASPQSGILKDPSFLVNHQAVKRALENDQVFVTDTFAGHGGAVFGPELFVSARIGPEAAVVCSVRRRRGAPGFEESDRRLVAELVRAAALALERFVYTSGCSIQQAEAGGPVPDNYYGLVCRSAAMRGLVSTIERIKDTDFPVCIFGESGTGKELVARAIHQAGRRSQGPFVAESAGAITETLAESELFGHVKGAFTGAEENKDGLFVLASGGTLYLDEIGDMSHAVQTKILRVIQEGKVRPVGGDREIEVDVRLVASTNRNLERLVEEGIFREDLYWRLNVISINVPPLRERLEDLPDLVGVFLERFRREGMQIKRLSEPAFRALEAYHWPGNVRQLGNVLRRALLTAAGKRIGRGDILRYLGSGSNVPWQSEDMRREESSVILRVPFRETFKELIGECEKVILRNALREFRGNKSEVTRALRIPRQSLYNKLERYGLLGGEAEPEAQEESGDQDR